MNPKILEVARRLPGSPGVYLFKDSVGSVIYVGKAQDLRKRVASYLRAGGDGRFLLQFLGREAADLEFLVTETEQEAVLLENTLIKKFKPKHNIKLKDDKAYLMLRLDPAEEWPWFRLVRRRKNDGAFYFGPFSSASAVRRTLKLLHRITPLRDCSDGVFDNRSRPCLKYQIGRCPAPCVGLITREDYQVLLDHALAILRGETKDVERELTGRMQRAAAALRFEEAQTAKDHLSALSLITEKQRVVSGGPLDRDVIGVQRAGDYVHLVLLSFRDRGLEGSRVHHFKTALPEDELLSSYISQHYAGDRYIPGEILVPILPVEDDTLGAWLGDRRGARVEIRVPQRGDKRKAVEMAVRNAMLAGEAWARGEDKSEEEIEAVQKLLGLAAPPRRIHCLDISTIQGRDTVASRVSCVDARPCTAEYRRFKIRGDAQGDDFAAMAQAVERSLRLCLEREGEELPDLLLVDGGKGQLEKARQALAELGLSDELAVAGLAKDRVKGDDRRHSGERIFQLGSLQPKWLAPGSPAHALLTRARDEAHRFAITYHRKLRGKIGSELDEIEGLGPRRRKALLKELGSLDAIREAELDVLVRVPGIPQKVAERVYLHYHKGD